MALKIDPEKHYRVQVARVVDVENARLKPRTDNVVKGKVLAKIAKADVLTVQEA
jgi:hypothetical protein